MIATNIHGYIHVCILLASGGAFRETTAMIFARLRRASRPDTISGLYGMIVAQARLPCFYREYGVADTVNGRFDLLILHLALAMQRMLPDPTLNGLGQGVFDQFCRDMDGNLREMGITDLKVPKEMNKMGEAYYGRAKAYEAALAAPGNEALAEAISRNIYGGAPSEPAAAQRLAAYMRKVAGELAGQTAAELAAGHIRFPDPAAIA
jgi:cytochrome b pre-mRNA-processing protein 3